MTQGHCVNSQIGVDRRHQYVRHALGHYRFRNWASTSFARRADVALTILRRKVSGLEWEWDVGQDASTLEARWRIHVALLPPFIPRLDTFAPPPPSFWACLSDCGIRGAESKVLRKKRTEVVNKRTEFAEIGMKADPMIPKACSIPCRCRV